MLLKKSILITCVLFLLSFQQNKVGRIIIVAYREPELMYGNIKQVIELRSDKIEGDIPQLCPFDTTTFDRKGDPIETKLGAKNGRCLLVFYKTIYNESGKKLETIVNDGNRKIYKYNDGGRITKSEYYSTSLQLLNYDIYRYNTAGEIMESDHFRGLNDSKPTKTKFECDLDGFLLSNGQLTYKYLSTDTKGNWTKRIITSHRFETKVDTITRKITYY
jgi:hypothetical protein